jgi:hypothetical protein
VNIRKLTSLGTTALLLTVVGCGGGGNGSGRGGTTGHGGTGATGATGGNGGTTGTGGANQTSDYSFTVTPTALSLPLGGMQSLSVTIDRAVGATTFTDPITFELDVPNTITGTGVTAQFTPTIATAGSTTLAVNIGTAGIAAGSYTLEVVGTSGADVYTVDLPLTVTVAKNTLLVDNDGSANNEDPTDTTNPQSPSDTLFASLLQGEAIGFNTFVADQSMAGSTAADPSLATITGYSTIVWYTGNVFGDHQTISPTQEAILEGWLDAGGHTLLVFAENLIYDDGVTTWIDPETDEFLANYVGAASDAEDNDLNHVTYTATGAAGTPFAGEAFHVIKDSPIGSSADVISPTTGTDTLATVVENPDEQLPAATTVAAVVGRKHVGAAGTSTVVYVGIPIENVLMTTGNNSATDFFHAVLVYAGLKTN